MGNCEKTCCAEKEGGLEAIMKENPEIAEHQVKASVATFREPDLKNQGENGESVYTKDIVVNNISQKTDRMVVQFENGGVYEGNILLTR